MRRLTARGGLTSPDFREGHAWHGKSEFLQRTYGLSVLGVQFRVSQFGVHPLTLEDIVQQESKEKLERFPRLVYHFVVCQAVEPHADEGTGARPVYSVVLREWICSVNRWIHPPGVSQSLTPSLPSRTLTTSQNMHIELEIASAAREDYTTDSRSVCIQADSDE